MNVGRQGVGSGTAAFPDFRHAALEEVMADMQQRFGTLTQRFGNHAIAFRTDRGDQVERSSSGS
jgi:hypothetical protein